MTNFLIFFCAFATWMFLDCLQRDVIKHIDKRFDELEKKLKEPPTPTTKGL